MTKSYVLALFSILLLICIVFTNNTSFGGNCADCADRTPVWKDTCCMGSCAYSYRYDKLGCCENNGSGENCDTTTESISVEKWNISGTCDGPSETANCNGCTDSPSWSHTIWFVNCVTGSLVSTTNQLHEVCN